VRGLEFRQIDPTRRRARRYHLCECRSLFGERAILIVWGRIGRPARARLETFETEAKLEDRWRELLARRKAHGYQLHTTTSCRSTRSSSLRGVPAPQRLHRPDCQFLGSPFAVLCCAVL
jgi:predicted DNA-binding WGR domain protein